MSAILIRPSPIATRIESPDLRPWDSERFPAQRERHRVLVAELDAEGNFIIMTPSNTDAEGRDILTQIAVWARSSGFGKAFGSSTGFAWPDRAVRSPDASVVRDEDWDALTDQQKTSLSARVSVVRHGTPAVPIRRLPWLWKPFPGLGKQAGGHFSRGRGRQPAVDSENSRTVKHQTTAFLPAR